MTKKSKNEEATIVPAAAPSAPLATEEPKRLVLDTAFETPEGWVGVATGASGFWRADEGDVLFGIYRGEHRQLSDVAVVELTKPCVIVIPSDMDPKAKIDTIAEVGDAVNVNVHFNLIGSFSRLQEGQAFAVKSMVTRQIWGWAKDLNKDGTKKKELHDMKTYRMIVEPVEKATETTPARALSPKDESGFSGPSNAAALRANMDALEARARGSSSPALPDVAGVHHAAAANPTEATVAQRL